MGAVYGNFPVTDGNRPVIITSPIFLSATAISVTSVTSDITLDTGRWLDPEDGVVQCIRFLKPFALSTMAVPIAIPH